MSLFDSIDLRFVFSGCGVGLLVGLTGTGGGSLMTPLLVLLFGIHPAVAVGTDLLFIAITKSLGTVVHGVKGTVDWPVVGRLALGSVPATIVTILAVGHYRHELAAVGKVITVALGCAVILTALMLVLRTWIQGKLADRQGDGPPAGHTTLYAVALGVFLGVVVSISSVGAGAIGVSVLMLLYPRLPMGRLVGSDIAHAVPLTLIAGIGYWILGSIDWPLLGSLLIGSLPGITIGSLLSSRSPDRIVRSVLASVLLIVGVRLVAW